MLGTISDALRTMQRILSAYSKQGRPSSSLRGLRIPERDKLQMQIHSRKKVSYSWAQAVQIAQHIRKNMNGLRVSVNVMRLWFFSIPLRVYVRANCLL